MARSNDPLDTYSLRVLVTLLTERNLTRVATRMNQTQPAISAVLRRLRTTFQDELLVRSGNTMVPTPRGLEVLESARNALSAMDRLFTVGGEFVPHTSQQQFKIGCPTPSLLCFWRGWRRSCVARPPTPGCWCTRWGRASISSRRWPMASWTW